MNFIFIFSDGKEKYATRKHSLVLGGDPEPKQRTWGKQFTSNKKPRPLYNHCMFNGNFHFVTKFGVFVIFSWSCSEYTISLFVRVETCAYCLTLADANGCGWWDCDMEGVDTEDVGTGEIWEGVGSTTFGGIWMAMVSFLNDCWFIC